MQVLYPGGKEFEDFFLRAEKQSAWRKTLGEKQEPTTIFFMISIKTTTTTTTTTTTIIIIIIIKVGVGVISRSQKQRLYFG